MAINLASKYSTKVDERFSLLSLTENIGLNKEYDWSGVATVTAYSIDTAAMNNYVRTGADRYGVPAELGDTKKDYTLTKDRSFTYTIDRGNYTEQMMVKEAGKSLARQIKEVVTPEIDIYRMGVWSAAAIANLKTATAAITAANAYIKLLDAQEALDTPVSFPQTSQPRRCSLANISNLGGWLTTSAMSIKASGFLECSWRGDRIRVRP